MNNRFNHDDSFISLDPDSDISPSPAENAPAPQNTLPGSGFETALALETPYPPAKAATRNEKYAELIRSSYSGRESELTAAMSFIYHGLKFSKSCPELSKAFIEIAVCEMRHLILLGKLLVSLGGDPGFYCRLPTNSIAGGWWNAGPLTLGSHSTIDAALQSGITAEKGSIAEYKSISEYIDDRNIRALLNRIAADEKLHLETLEAFYLRFCS